MMKWEEKNLRLGWEQERSEVQSDWKIELKRCEMKWLGLTLVVMMTGNFLFPVLSSSSSVLPLREATFVVGWYDIGKAALDGQPGVVNVEKGWLNMSEINRVVFNPAKTNVNRIEETLKESGTYIRTIPQRDGPPVDSDSR